MISRAAYSSRFAFSCLRVAATSVSRTCKACFNSGEKAIRPNSHSRDNKSPSSSVISCARSGASSCKIKSPARTLEPFSGGNFSIRPSRTAIIGRTDCAVRCAGKLMLCCHGTNKNASPTRIRERNTPLPLVNRIALRSCHQPLTSRENGLIIMPYICKATIRVANVLKTNRKMAAAIKKAIRNR